MILKRDPHSNAVLNTDAQALNKYKQERALYRKVEVLSKELIIMKETVASLCAKIEKIENN